MRFKMIFFDLTSKKLIFLFEGLPIIEVIKINLLFFN